MELAAALARRRRCRAIAVAAVAVSLLASVTYWLAASGTTTTSIAPAPGLSPEGTVADVVTMSTSVTRSNGAASLQTGKTIAKLLAAKDFTNKIKVSVAWTNPVDAAKVLLNPNAQISLGLYRPVSAIASGNCSTSGALKVTDGATSFCTLLDSAAGGSTSVSGGQLLLSQSILTGFLAPTVNGSTTAACAADAGGPTAWCQPSTALAGADQRLLYVVASILTPGGIPQGQQSQVGGLAFYVKTTT